METRHGRLDFSRGPAVMGILNVTPDSFSDGGAYVTTEAAVRRADEMIAEGAAIIDVGGESTRPGSAAVPAEEQIRRTAPVIETIRQRHPAMVISIDTRCAAVALAALEAGADMINDVSALREDAAMAELAAGEGVPVVLMHMRGSPADMQAGGGPFYADVVREVLAFLNERVEFTTQRGVERGQIVIDPGLGFGKRMEHNLTLLRCLHRFVTTGLPVLVGASRKKFVGAATGMESPAGRLGGSLACAAVATLAGVSILRVHDVRATVEAAAMCRAISRAP